MSQHGLWLLIDGTERFLAFDDFPWFREATIGQLARIERPSAEHFHWPELDVDLTFASIDRPESQPLVSKAGQARPPGTR